MRKFFYLFLLTTCFQVTVFGQGYLHRSGKTIVDGNNNEIILHGIGIGGWLVQEGYMYGNSGAYYTQHAFKAKLAKLIGSTETEIFYTNWRNNFMQQRDIDSIASWGYNSIRVPMHYNLFRRCFTADPQNDEGFRLIDNLVTWAKTKGIYVILDMHATPGGQGDDTGISDRDNTKPYLWTSTANQDSLVQMWKNIATKYANESVIGGYDLINETNYAPMKPSNQQLRDLYGRLTTTIRAVDNNHILFIEGNDFANNFTGLTPAWDNNMAYSFHKYWSTTDAASILGMIDLRNSTDRPLWLGETGENGNAWFTAVIKTLEAAKIGYSNWSYKPYDKIQSPITIKPFANWQKVLDYVNNDVALSAANCIAYLKQMTDGLLLENCRINKDEIDAWTRQPFDNTTLPYATNNIPGIFFAANYDLGTQGVAYSDQEYQTLTQNPWVDWNKGYTYRNDGVDLEKCTDVAPYNLGYDIGWTADNEWMLYTVNVAASGYYDLDLRCANGSAGTGTLHIEINGVDVSGSIAIAPTGGYSTWQTFKATGISLNVGVNKMKLKIDKAGMNINAFDWKTSSNVPAIRLLSATAINDTTIRLDFNKILNNSIAPSLSDFKINTTSSYNVSKINFDPNTSSSLFITTKNYLFYNESITIDYSGSLLESVDHEKVPAIVKGAVKNEIPKRFIIAGKVEAEDFVNMTGIQLESCTDTGAGQDIGYTDAGDYLEYSVYVKTSGIYNLIFRMAGNGGQAKLTYADAGNVADIATITFSATGSWQTWKDFAVNAPLTVGPHKIRLSVVQSGFNLNYMNFVLVSTSLHTNLADAGFDFYPNPVKDEFTIHYFAETSKVLIEVLNLSGSVVLRNTILGGGEIQSQYSVSEFPSGVYVIRVIDGKKIITQKMVIA